jgi:para-nitrobenzyl esterase
MKKLVVAIAIITVAALLAVFRPWVPKPAADSRALRHSPAGDVVGFADRHNTFAWLGVPFAKPPVGDLRWRAPQPLPQWREERPALAFSPPCAQLKTLTAFDKHAPAGSEDCLYLNIWAPIMASKRLPVMVWIHGGGDTMGLAEATPGSHLAGAEHVVVVSLQYRLGVFGWFCHPALRHAAATPADASTNFGLLDLVAGLQWVHDNIAAFGGDPANVTIFGESSGGHDVMALMAAAPAKGLFQRAISESGSVHAAPRSEAENYSDDAAAGLPFSSREFINQLLIADGAKDRAAAKARQQAMDDQTLLSYLRGKTPKQLLAVVTGASFGMYDWPVIIRDGYAVPDRPAMQVFTDPAQYNAVPVMLGGNRDEYKLFMMGDPDLTAMRFGFVPIIRDLAAYNRITGYYSARWRAEAQGEVAALLHKNQGDTVYTYRFDWDDEPSYGPVNLHDLWGASHSVEINFVFGDDVTTGVPFVRSKSNGAGRDALSRAIMGYWASFARDGAPGNSGNPANPVWRPWRETGPSLMILNSSDHGGLRMPGRGGLRMIDDRQRIADIKERLRTDSALATPVARCKLYSGLFHAGFGDRIYWDAAEYKSLGCESYPPGNFPGDRVSDPSTD